MPRRGAGVLVEFVGLPGAGKTTLADQVLERLPSDARRTPPTRSLLRRLAEKVRAAWKGRGATSAFVRGLMSDSRALSAKVRAFRWFLTTLEAYDRCQRSAGVAILSEGGSQRAILGFVDVDGRPPATSLESYLAGVPLPDLLVEVRVSVDRSMQRLAARRADAATPRDLSAAPGGRDLARLPEEHLRRFLSNAEGVIFTVTDTMQRRGVDVISVDGSDPSTLDDACERIVGWLAARS